MPDGSDTWDSLPIELDLRSNMPSTDAAYEMFRFGIQQQIQRQMSLYGISSPCAAHKQNIFRLVDMPLDRTDQVTINCYYCCREYRATIVPCIGRLEQLLRASMELPGQSSDIDEYLRKYSDQ